MTQYDYDYFVIGAGSGGVRSARIAASYGARVAVAEEFRCAMAIDSHAKVKQWVRNIERQERLIRPTNLPPGTPGRGAGLYKARNGADVLANPGRRDRLESLVRTRLARR